MCKNAILFVLVLDLHYLKHFKNRITPRVAETPHTDVHRGLF